MPFNSHEITLWMGSLTVQVSMEVRSQSWSPGGRSWDISSARADTESSGHELIWLGGPEIDTWFRSAEIDN